MSASRIVTTIARLLDTNTGEELPYECKGCLERYEIQYHSCPECGSYQVDRTVWQVE